MSDWRPSSGAAAARRRAAMLERARAYFTTAGVLAVDTPALGTFAVTDPAIESFAVTSCDGRERFLQTSPEYYMKRLLAAGYPDIYSIARVFRDGEAGTGHLPEFTLIEWYRLGFGLDDIVTDTVALLAACLEQPELVDAVDRLDYGAAFLKHAGVDVFAASIDDLAARVAADERLRSAVGSDRDAWLDLILDDIVLPCFDGRRITVLQHFPASKAALARLCPDDPRVADRFEIIHAGLELANGYVELVDAAEQRRRFEAEAGRRSRRAAGPPDAALLAALDAGLPECAGVAVGAERLQMVYDRTDNIADVVTFASEYSGGRG